MNWDQKLRAKSRAVTEDQVTTLVSDPDDLVGNTYRCVVQQPGRIYGAMARVRVLSLTKSRSRAICDVLTGRLAGQQRTLQVCNLMEDKP